MVLVYFYNTRHKYEARDELDEFVVAKKPKEKAIYSPNEDFNWNLYESDLSYDYDKFIGYTQWKNKEVAENRISKLRDEYKTDNSILKINMLETMMLVDKFGEDIILDASGVYRIRKINIENFLDELNYTIEIIKQISLLKDELEFSIENYEVDAKKIFYIMKNARSFGLYNFDNHSQVFLFAKKHHGTTIDTDIVIEDSKGVSEMNLLIEEFVEHKELEAEQEEVNEHMFDAFKRIKDKVNIYRDVDGNRIVEYPNGQKIIKKSLWEVEAIEEEEPQVNRQGDKTKKFSDYFKDEKVATVMEEANNESVKKFELKLKDKIIIEKTKVGELIKINNSFIKRAKLYDDNNNKKDFIGFIGEVKNVKEFIDKIRVMSEKNIKSILILILSIDAAQLNLDENNTTCLIFDFEGESYISYEYLALVLLSLIDNRSEFATSTKTIANNGHLLYPISIVESFIKYLTEIDIDFSNTQSEFLYLESMEKNLLSLSAIKLSTHSQKLLSTYNSHDKVKLINAKIITKDSFKKATENKYPINFKIFCK